MRDHSQDLLYGNDEPQVKRIGNAPVVIRSDSSGTLAAICGFGAQL